MKDMNEIEMLDEDFRQHYSQYQHESGYILNNQELLVWDEYSLDSGIEQKDFSISLTMISTIISSLTSRVE